MRRKLDSESGKAIYGKRKYNVDPPFGHIKPIMRFTRFQFRGTQKVTGEFKFVSITTICGKTWFYVKVNNKNFAGMCLSPRSQSNPNKKI